MKDESAFPNPYIGNPEVNLAEPGLTKLEYAAIEAMKGILSDSHIMNEIRCDDDLDTADMVAGLAWEYAAALFEKAYGKGNERK